MNYAIKIILYLFMKKIILKTNLYIEKKSKILAIIAQNRPTSIYKN